MPLAGPVTRGIALMVDLGVLAVLIIMASTLFNLFSSLFYSLPVIGDVLIDFASGVMILFVFAVVMLYGALFEWIWKGQTVGKRVMKLRVIDERGLSLSKGQIVLRNLFRLVDILPSLFYLVGGVSCIFTKRCQRLGDIAAGTVVVRELEVKPPEIGEILDEIDNSFADLPHLEARLRQNTSPEEARIALDAVVRRDDFSDESRLVVFGEIADHFREAADFPEEITLGLSDEQYVRNVVDTLFRRSAA